MTPRLHSRARLGFRPRIRLVALLIACSACDQNHGMKGEPDSAPTATAKLVTANGVAPNPAVRIANDETDDGQWARPAKDYASSRYSQLGQINTTNVGALRVSFTFSLGVNRGQEAAPLVVGGTMYVVTPYPNLSTHSTSRSRARRPNGRTSRSPKRPLRGSPAATW